MAAILPFDLDVDEPRIGFVHQCRSLERVIGALSAENSRGDTMQLVIDERGEFVEAALIPVDPAAQQFSNVWIGQNRSPADSL